MPASPRWKLMPTRRSTVDSDIEAVVAAAGRWATSRREAEVAAVIAWSQRHRQRRAERVEACVAGAIGPQATLDALTAAAAARGFTYPAYIWPGGHPRSAVRAGAHLTARRVCRCQGGVCRCA
jgi:hypothetical protein